MKAQKEKKIQEVKEQETQIKKIKIYDNHTYKYLDKLRETTYKGEKVVFILPNGKEY